MRIYIVMVSQSFDWENNERDQYISVGSKVVVGVIRF